MLVGQATYTGALSFYYIFLYEPQWNVIPAMTSRFRYYVPNEIDLSYGSMISVLHDISP